MKKLAAALMIAGAALLAGTSIASAQQDPYGPGPSGGTTTPTVAPGGEFGAVVTGCPVPSTWDFTFQDQSHDDVQCVAGSGGGFLLGFLAVAPTGTATAQFRAPTAPGTYSGTAVSGATTVTFSITVQAGAATTTPATGIPATGSNTTGPAMTVALVLLVVGAGMFGVAHMRRRQAVTTS